MSRNWQDISVAPDWQLRKELTAEKVFISDFGLRKGYAEKRIG
jgi:hypothetical protein